MADLYGDLGVGPDATDAEIKAAARHAQKKHHPDVGGDPEAFHRVQRAVAILRDPDKRRRYDETGSTGEGQDGMSDDTLALSLLSQVLSMAIGQIRDPERFDLVLEMRKMLQQASAQHADRGRAAAASVDRLKKAKARLIFKGNGANALAEILDGHIREAAQHKAAAEQAVRVHDLALTMAADYSYRVEAPQPGAYSLDGGPVRRTGMWAFKP